MGLMFRSYLEEGYYEEDGMGGLSKIEDPREISNALSKGTLFENDGYATTKVPEETKLHQILEKL